MGANHAWGATSLERIGTLDPRWRPVLNDVLAAVPFDVTVIFGFRGEDAQNAAWAAGNSTKQWPNSIHNTMPSRAVDLAPLNADGSIPGYGDAPKDPRPWLVLAGAVLAAARAARMPCRWGGNWDCDAVMLDDQDFDDLGHFEAGEEDMAA
jgi:hypothetical protein